MIRQSKITLKHLERERERKILIQPEMHDLEMTNTLIHYDHFEFRLKFKDFFLFLGRQTKCHKQL